MFHSIWFSLARLRANQLNGQKQSSAVLCLIAILLFNLAMPSFAGWINQENNLQSQFEALQSQERNSPNNPLPSRSDSQSDLYLLENISEILAENLFEGETESDELESDEFSLGLVFSFCRVKTLSFNSNQQTHLSQKFTLAIARAPPYFSV